MNEQNGAVHFVDSSDSIFLSIVIPAHNEESRLPVALRAIRDFLLQQPYAAEIIVVENGSHDRTFEIAQSFAASMPNLRVLREDQRGKGLAVRSGMLAARGQYRFICDVDLSMPIEEVNRFLPPQISQPQVVIGSREAPGAVRYHEPAYRHIIGRIFNSMVRWMALPGLQDTQCGFKMFRADVAERVFPLQTLTGMSFDVEVLFIARHMGYTISEVPVNWYFNPDSRVRLVEDSLRMGSDLLHIRRNARQGRYGPPVQPR
jgi:glycosyltransferase involved in cell wall biosynthesis